MKSASEIRREASDAQILAARFPNMSKATLEANGMGRESDRKPVVTPEPPAKGETAGNLVLVLTGQVRGGKNNMGRTKTGRSFPKKQFVVWRDEAIRQIRSQLPPDWQAVSTPANVRLDYVSGDKRRRDFPAICDALWHVLERSGVVTDDTLLWPAQSSRSYSKTSPGVVITFL
jgi:Holliday junction resolvase RusA-like endonuclease